MSYDGNPVTFIGRKRPALGSPSLTDEAKEAKFQEYLAAEAVAIAAGKEPPPTAAWPIEKRRELWMKRYPA